MSDTVLAPVRAVLALPNDDPRKTLAVALALCLACSVVVSATAVGLRPLQARNAALELKREVVKVAGLDDPGVPLSQAFGHIETRLLDLETGTLVDGDAASTFAYRDAARDPGQSKALEDDPAGIRRRPNRMPVYLVRDGGALETIVLPVYGQGLWSTMHGLLALAPDGRTAKGLTFYEQRETAGLGSEVASPRWLAQAMGRQDPHRPRGRAGHRGGEGQRATGRPRCRAQGRRPLRRHAHQQRRRAPDGVLARRARLWAFFGAVGWVESVVWLLVIGYCLLVTTRS